jgi:NitT/TauT family transport system ATP-binding protein
MIEVKDVYKVFPGAGTTMLAVKGVNLTIQSSEFVAIVGPSGCGKSTLLNMMAGLTLPSRGAILHDGRPVTDVNTAVGYMTQKDTLLPWRTTKGNVDVALELRGTSKSDRDKVTQKFLGMVGLQGFEKFYPRQLSGGMRKRVLLARTLVYEPTTILMDEPFGALDAQLKLVMQAELLKIWERTKHTIVFVTHDLAEAILMADRVIVFSKRPGQIKLVKTISLPRPRDVSRLRVSPEYGQIYEELWSALEVEFAEERR